MTPARIQPLSTTDNPCRFAFTLIELLAVISLIAIFAGVLGYAFLRGGGSTVGLQGAQSSMSGMLTLARGQAAMSGRNAALLVANGPSSGGWVAATPHEVRDRYLRFVIPVLRDETDTAWVPFSDGVYLPQGIYVVPYDAPSGAMAEPDGSWSGLNSSRLATAETSLALGSSISSAWIGIEFTPRGTLTPASGPGIGNRIVIGSGRLNSSSSDPPVIFQNPANVRGMVVSAYGIARMVNDPNDF